MMYLMPVLRVLLTLLKGAVTVGGFILALLGVYWVVTHHFIIVFAIFFTVMLYVVGSSWK